MANNQSCNLPLQIRAGVRGLIIASILLGGVEVALAAPGDLDPGFNGSGLLSLNVGRYWSGANAVVQQSDGKLVLAGSGNFNDDDGWDMVAVRVTADGTPDGSFSTDGVASADIEGWHDDAHAVIQQTDGKLMLAGSAFNPITGDDDIALARFNADGTLDSTFGNDGRATLDMGGNDVARGVIQQPGGKLVIGGDTNSGGSYRQVFARFNANGTLDATFGTGGTTLVDFGAGSESSTNDIAQQPDGKLVAVGVVFGPATEDIGIARVTANGSLDSSFDGDGLLIVDIDAGNERAMTVAIKPDGVIVVAGYTVPPGGGTTAVLLSVNEDGSFDNTFGTAGKAVADLGGGSLLNSIVVQADGRLVAMGTRFTDDGGQDMILARFSSDGALDTTYGINGVAIADFGTGAVAPFSEGAALVRQIDGKYVTVGPNSLGTFGAARFDDSAEFPGRVGLVSTGASVAETSAAVSYAVRRTGGRTGAVSVNYATAAGQAQPGTDFENTSGTLTWNDGDASDKTLTVNIFDDAVAESNEDFSLTLSAPTGGAQLAASEATTSITNDDGPGQLGFRFGLDLYSVLEGNSTINVPVQRSGGSQGAVSVNYRPMGNTAGAGSDFEDTTGTLSWADGESGIKMASVRILDDAVVEHNEDFTLRLSNPTGGATVPLLAGIQLMAIVDNETGFSMASGVASIGEAGGSIILSVSRTGPATGAVSVNYATSSGSANAGSDFMSASGTLNWADGDSDVKEISVSITNDTADETNEQFAVSLSSPSAGMGFGLKSTTVTIVDDDAPAGGGGGGGSGGGGGGGALDWLAALFLAGLTFLRRRRVFQST